MKSHRFRAQLLRFLVSGAVNTGVTYAIYLGLLLAFPYAVSYTVAFVVGIGLSYALNRWFVFSTSRGVKTLALFPLIYVVQYVVGIAIVYVWVSILGLSQLFAPLAAIVLVIPVTFTLTRTLFVTRTDGRSTILRP